MKFDRGIIKWAPFNSVAPSKEIINRLNQEKQKINKPILSEEQLNCLQQKLLESYTGEIKTTIEYYKNGKILKECSFINRIDLNQRRIILTNNKIIYFNQIIKINN
ncbi:MAG: YolD-like family protein [Bacilli bacterium]|nr:YolD-like family protein [Bacilli bacterium]